MRQSDLFVIELFLQIVSLGEFIVDVISHLGDFVLCLLHFLAYSELKTLYFFEIFVDVLFLYLELSGGACRVVKLALFELEVLFHVVYLHGGWQLILPLHSLLHMLE